MSRQNDVTGDSSSVDNLRRTLRITSLDDDDEDESPIENCPNQITQLSEEDEYEEDEEDETVVTLGFVEKPKNDWSLLPHFFPSKAGGFPVIFIIS